MPKEECIDKIAQLKKATEIIDGALSSYQDDELPFALFQLQRAVEEVEIDKDIPRKTKDALITEISSVVSDIKINGKGKSDIANKLIDLETNHFVAMIDVAVECECGEMGEIQLKIPIKKSDTVEDALKNAGYDVGTDAYYEDPDNFVSVIVRATKELDLRRGGR